MIVHSQYLASSEFHIQESDKLQLSNARSLAAWIEAVKKKHAEDKDGLTSGIFARISSIGISVTTLPLKASIGVKRRLLFALIFSAWLAGGPHCFAGKPLTALLENVRGSVTEVAGVGGGHDVRLKAGKTVPAGRKVTAGQVSVAIYTISGRFMLKQDPRTSLKFSSIAHTTGTNGAPAWNVSVDLDNGDLYTALRSTGETMDYGVTTSRIEAITHDATFKVSHADSTSTVYDKKGTVKVFYCSHSKTAVVHAGEVLIVTDCEGTLRWQTEEEGREMTLFAALQNSGFGKLAVDSPENAPVKNGGASSLVIDNGGDGGSMSPIFSPRVPPDPPLISP